MGAGGEIKEPNTEGWGPDGRDLLATKHLLIAILTPHPLWLACVGEILARRAPAPVSTTLLTFQDAGLYDPDQRSHFRRVEQLAAAMGQDPMTRFRNFVEELRGPASITWMDVQPSAVTMTALADDATVQRLAPINLTSESLSLTRSRFAAQLLPEEVRRWMLDSWARTYTAVGEAIADTAPDALLVFNGRFVLDGAARGAGLAAGLPVYGFDRGIAPDSITVYRNHVHDYASIARYAEFLWTRGDVAAHERSAARWIEDRVLVRGGGDNPHSLSFHTDGQIFSPDAGTRVAVFTSSSDELFSIDTDADNTPEGQMRWMHQLLELSRSRPSADVHVRVHPNMADKPLRDLAEWDELAASAPPNVTIHGPTSGTNTYALMRTADLVITFGSTVTAEAAYFDKPVVELGRTQMSLLGVCSAVASPEALARIIDDPVVARQPHQCRQALKYAHWYLNSGDPLTYAHFDDVDASIAGRSLEPFGKVFRATRRTYRHLIRLGLPARMRSRHGLASLPSE